MPIVGHLKFGRRMRVPVDTTQPFNESEWQRPLRTYVDLSPPERNSLDNDRLAHAGHFEHPLFVRHTIALLALADRDEDEEDSRADQNNLLTRCASIQAFNCASIANPSRRTARVPSD